MAHFVKIGDDNIVEDSIVIDNLVGKKSSLQGRLLMIFDDFGGPQGGSKITKNRKKAFQKSIKKKTEKKRQ